MQAAVATLLDLKLEEVPNFISLTEELWHTAFIKFFKKHGYSWQGNCKFEPDLYWNFEEKHAINGHFYASAPSRTFEGRSHAIIVDLNAKVVHDPNPNKLWMGENIWQPDAKDDRYLWTVFERNEL